MPNIFPNLSPKPQVLIYKHTNLLLIQSHDSHSCHLPNITLEIIKANILHHQRVTHVFAGSSVTPSPKKTHTHFL